VREAVLTSSLLLNQLQPHTSGVGRQAEPSQTAGGRAQTLSMLDFVDQKIDGASGCLHWHALRRGSG
jgi:hypothetical protein